LDNYSGNPRQKQETKEVKKTKANNNIYEDRTVVFAYKKIV
jgi:hypothetical protein